ncbi:hypothetical protein AB0E82_30835 [Streptomyces anulatus]|uniref:hypothetical protein n=1 Tax=Streptomyces anulatus TaxID=1892 RepID=UPI0033D477C7
MSKSYPGDLTDGHGDLVEPVITAWKALVDQGFVPQAKRWIEEQANGILMFYRRLVRD